MLLDLIFFAFLKAQPCFNLFTAIIVGNQLDTTATRPVETVSLQRALKPSPCFGRVGGAGCRAAFAGSRASVAPGPGLATVELVSSTRSLGCPIVRLGDPVGTPAARDIHISLRGEHPLPMPLGRFDEAGARTICLAAVDRGRCVSTHEGAEFLCRDHIVAVGIDDFEAGAEVFVADAHCLPSARPLLDG